MVVADWIRFGLGATSLSTAQSSVGSVSSTNGTVDYGELSACVASWASYISFTESDIAVVNRTSTSHLELNTRLTHGAGAVYTTYDGIPVVSGNFTPTKIISTTINVSSTSVSNVETTYHPAQVSASPTCDFAYGCSRLYASYMSSLGLSKNASIPKITPAPANSPGCPAYYYRPFSSCSYWTDPVNTCTVAGQNVQVFYFPLLLTNVTTGKVVYSYAPNITFTSPSIYLSFDWLSATSSLGALESACSSCGYNGCVATAVGGGDGYSVAGTSIGGALITLAPEEASTFIMSYQPAEASSVASVLANGGPAYADVQADLSSRNFSYSYLAQRLDLHKLVNPLPTDYYLNPAGAPGCDGAYPQPKCSTIFEGEYRPILSLPPHVSDLQPAWSTCLPAVFGVYDPPIALTEGSVANLPTIHDHVTPSTTHHTSPPTALPETLPDSSILSPTSRHTTQQIIHSESGVGGSEATTDPPATENSGSDIRPTSQPNSASIAAFHAGTQSFTATCISDQVVFGTHTIAVGGAATSVGGQAVSAASDGVVVGSSTNSWVTTATIAVEPSSDAAITAADASRRPSNQISTSAAVKRSISTSALVSIALLFIINGMCI
ncbi:hypothetical protein K431DRAFT_283135 [Polychaeton citri CBS 116435]|uniref:Uncharacterized protein n=1 Tax=Polychaeton citri CBS 116435 TaxID=1314669 RepID=A0A9P4USQ2_9PEZI|nr:hypothetical protein K431DRAFT_283135 [Polychaeton citri CBS 116435]